MFLSELYNFEGFLGDIDIIMTKYAYYSEYEYISNNRRELAKECTITYTDKRYDNTTFLTIEFTVLEDDPEYGDIWVKVTDFYED